MKTLSDYMNKTHTYGRIALLIATAVMLGIPSVICSVYDIWPEFSMVVSTVGPLLAIFIPTTLAETLSFTPITGSTAYVSCIMGNAGNIKFPCALAAMERSNSASGTERGEVMAMSGACVSGMVTTIIVAIGVILLVPLQPILTSPVVTTASQYIMPSLYGSMAISFFISKNAGAYVVEGKLKMVGVALPVTLVLFLLFPILRKNTGYFMLALIPCLIALARLFYNKGIVKIRKR